MKEEIKATVTYDKDAPESTKKALVELVNKATDMLNQEHKVQVSDTTEDDSSNDAGKQKEKRHLIITYLPKDPDNQIKTGVKN